MSMEKQFYELLWNFDDKPFNDRDYFSQFLKQNDYEVVIEHGQRILRPKDLSFKTDPIYQKCLDYEVYIRNLPNTVFESELLAFLKPIGSVYQIRLMLAFSGKTKGSAYVVFDKISNAFKAIDYLNMKRIRPYQLTPLEAEFSVNNKRLLVKNIPLTFDERLIIEQLKQNNIEGVVEAKMKTSKDTKAENVEAIIVFENHRQAAIARRNLVPGLVKFKDNVIACDWYKVKDRKTIHLNCRQNTFTKEMIQNPFTQSDGKFVANNFVRFETYGQTTERLNLITSDWLKWTEWGCELTLIHTDLPKRKTLKEDCAH